MNKFVYHNIVKNFVIVILLIPGYFLIKDFVANSQNTDVKAIAGDMIVVTSIIAVIACFGNFAFTYEKVRKAKSSILIAHITTGLFMLVVGLSLEMTSIFSRLLTGKFFVLDASLFLLYIATVLYDFWDLYRIERD